MKFGSKISIFTKDYNKKLHFFFADRVEIPIEVLFLSIFVDFAADSVISFFGESFIIGEFSLFLNQVFLFLGCGTFLLRIHVIVSLDAHRHIEVVQSSK